MPIKIGNTTINLIKVGSTEVTKVVVNGTTVYEKITKYTVTFKAKGATHATKQVNPNTSIGYSNMPSNPSRSGWTFLRWVYGSSNTTFSYNTTVASNLTVTAYWQRYVSSTQRCSSCRGSGESTCSFCYGSGRKSCGVCGGYGYVDGGQTDCWRCSAMGTVWQCNACGTIYSQDGFSGTCGYCGATYGFNEVTCDFCNGECFLEEAGHSCNFCNGNGSYTCPDCDGSGYGTCSTCDGSGTQTVYNYEYEAY